jgi:hypothetical protein
VHGLLAQLTEAHDLIMASIFCSWGDVILDQFGPDDICHFIDYNGFNLFIVFSEKITYAVFHCQDK